MADKKEVIDVVFPVGRVINQSLFVRDIYKDPKTGKEGNPSYKIEMAFNPTDLVSDDEDMTPVEEAMLNAAVATWGPDIEDTFFDGGVILPFKDGDEMAADREARDKPGDAYKGKLILRSHTQFNKDGEDGPGGIAVWSPEVTEISAVNASEVYNGCYGKMAGTINCYEDSMRKNQKMISVYLTAFQKTDDGERLATAKDTSKLFKAVGRAESSGGKRKSRKG